MPTDAQSTMADWLALHDLTPVSCSALLDKVPRPSSSAPKAGGVSVGLDAEAAWQRCAAAAMAALPEDAETVERVLSSVRTDFSSQIGSAGRAFTLHDDGNGVPFVSCHWTDTPRGLVVMAHEFGHAYQIFASKGRDVTPICREAAAYLSEIWVSDLMSNQRPAEGWGTYTTQRSASILGQGGALIDAVHEPEHRYDYAWNYPPARALAVLLQEHRSSEAILGLFRGTMSLRQLAAIMGASEADTL